MNWEMKCQVKAADWLRNFQKNNQKRVRALLGMAFKETDPCDDCSRCSCFDDDYDDYWNDRRPRKEKKEGKTFDGPNSFGKALQNKGYKLLGSGAYSTVYGHPNSDRVIKVNRRPDNWIDYCLWAAKNGYAGTLAPKVYSFKNIKGYDQEFQVSVVEKMAKTISRLGGDQDFILVSDMFKYYVEYDNLIAGVMLDDLVPGLPDFGKKLTEKYGRLDLHGGNIMIRPDGSVCVTDPVTEDDDENTVKYTRLKAGDFTSLATLISLCYKGRYESSSRRGGE